MFPADNQQKLMEMYWDGEYQRITAMEISIEIKLRDEPGGDRYFVVADPNRIEVDIVALPTLRACLTCV